MADAEDIPVGADPSIEKLARRRPGWTKTIICLSCQREVPQRGALQKRCAPLSSFHFSSPKDPEFKSAWALTNLRPLWRQDNRSKHARRLHLI